MGFGRLLFLLNLVAKTGLLRSDAVLLVFADVGIGSPVRFSSTSAFHIICKCQMCAITHPTLGFMKALFTSLEHCGVLPQEAVELLSCGPIEMFTAVELFTASEASGCGALPVLTIVPGWPKS